MERRIDEDRLGADVDAVLCKHAHHGGDALFNGARAVLELDHRRVQPDRIAKRRLDALAVCRALPDDGRRRHIARLQRVHERLTLGVDEHCADRAHLFRDQRAKDLRRERRARGMVRKRVGRQESCTRAVAEDESVGGRAVVVRGRKALIVESARAAGRKDDRLCPRDQKLLCLHVQKHRACAASLLVLDKLDGRGEIHDLNIRVIQHLVAERAHDLRTGVVLCRVHTLAGGAAAVRRDHGAVGRLVKFDAKTRKPLDGLRRVHDELAEKILLRGKMPAAVGVKEVLRGRIVRLVGGLNAALRHHGVGVARAELRDEQDLRACLVRLNGRRAACAAAADDEHVRIVVRLGQARKLLSQTGAPLQQRCQLQRHLAALVRADAKLGELVFTVVRVECPQQDLLLLCRHAARVELCIFLAACFHPLDGFQNFRIGIHCFSLLTFRSRGGCKAP